MAERSQSTESANIHERGGLTPEHWKRVFSVVEKRDTKKEKISAATVQEIRDYASSVINGDIQDVNFAHREHLGTRHWRVIEKQVGEKGLGHRWIGEGFSLRRKFNRQLQKDLEIFIYAGLESEAIYTVEYYFNFLDPTISMKGNPEFDRKHWGYRLFLTWTGSSWEKTVNYTDTVEGFSNCEDPDAWSSGTYSLGFAGKEEEEMILRHWLLTSKEVQNPLHTSPENFNAILREFSESNPQETKERIINHFGKAWFWQIRWDRHERRWGLYRDEWLNLCKLEGITDADQIERRKREAFRLHYGVEPFNPKGMSEDQIPDPL